MSKKAGIALSLDAAVKFSVKTRWYFASC